MELDDNSLFFLNVVAYGGFTKMVWLELVKGFVRFLCVGLYSRDIVFTGMRIELCFMVFFFDSMIRHWLFMMMGGVDSGIVILAIRGSISW